MFRNVWEGLVGIVKGVWNGILGWIEGGVNGARTHVDARAARRAHDAHGSDVHCVEQLIGQAANARRSRAADCLSESSAVPHHRFMQVGYSITNIHTATIDI